MKCANCGKEINETGKAYESNYRQAMMQLHINTVDCSFNVITLGGGEQICKADKYLVSRHTGSIYTDDFGEAQICGLVKQQMEQKA